MLQGNRNDRFPQGLERLSLDSAQIDRWGGANMRRLDIGKGVVEGHPKSVFNGLVAIDGDGVPQIELEKPQIVESHDVIRVLVGVGHGVDQADFFSQELGSQVRRRINKQVSLGKACNHATAGSLITRVTASAHGAAASEGRDTDGSARSEHDEFARDVGRQWFFGGRRVFQSDLDVWRSVQDYQLAIELARILETPEIPGSRNSGPTGQIRASS